MSVWMKSRSCLHVGQYMVFTCFRPVRDIFDAVISVPQMEHLKCLIHAIVDFRKLTTTFVYARLYAAHLLIFCASLAAFLTM